MVTRLDRHVGQVMSKLGEVGLDSNTLMIVTSDNGPSAERVHEPDFFASGAGLRGYKRDLYEGGVRVPFIARWAGRIQPGSTSDHVCAFWDFLPTAVELAGLPPVERTDGISFAPTLFGREQPEHEYLYFDYGHVRKQFRQAVRWGRWKGVRNGVDSPVELYDLEDDRAERTDVAAANPQVVAKIERILIEAYVPSPDYPVEGV